MNSKIDQNSEFFSEKIYFDEQNFSKLYSLEIVFNIEYCWNDLCPFIELKGVSSSLILILIWSFINKILQYTFSFFSISFRLNYIGRWYTTCLKWSFQTHKNCSTRRWLESSTNKCIKCHFMPLSPKLLLCNKWLKWQFRYQW